MCVCFVTGPTPKTGNNCTSLYFIISFIISCLSRAWTFWFHFQEFKTTYWIDPRRTEVRGDGLRLPAQRERPTANKAVEVHRLLGGRLWERGTDGLLRNGGWRRSGILKTANSRGVMTLLSDQQTCTSMVVVGLLLCKPNMNLIIVGLVYS